MSVWLIVWVVVAVALIGFMGWTLLVTVRQKAAWKKFAKARKLRFKARPFMISPEMSGAIGAHTFDFFTAEHASFDARGTRKLTAIEVSLNSKMPVWGGIASGGMVPLVQGLGFKQEYRPDHPGWNKSYIAAANNRFVLEAYLTPERVEGLTDLMKIKNSWVTFIFQDDLMLVRVDLPDPLESAGKIDKLTKKLSSVASVLELATGEASRLESDTLKSAAQSIELEVDDAVLEASSGLALEGDGDGNDVVDADASIEKPEKKP